MQLGWIDFSREDRANALGFIHLLREQGAVDELGIGALRDQIADRLFPGTSTLITRAKYYLLVPYLLRVATDGTHGWKYREVKEWLDDQERVAAKRMISRHRDENDSNGIIGYLALKQGKWVTRAPSEIYWNGIRTYGICPGNFSLAEYVKRALGYAKNKGAGLGSACDGEDGSGDDSNAGEQYAFKPLDLKGLPVKNLLSGFDIELRPEEAEFLKGKILKNVPESVLAFILRNDDVDPDLFRDGYYFSAFADFVKDRVSDENAACLELAQKFGTFVRVARVRYNVIFQRRHPGADAVFDGGTAEEIWERIVPTLKSDLDFNYRDTIVRLGFAVPDRLREFIRNLRLAFMNGDFNAADCLIIDQEKDKKGQGRSKLMNAKCYSSDRWIGGEWLDFRLSDAAKIIRDIRNGLGGAE